MTDKLTATMQIAERVYSLAQGQNDSAVTIGACHALSRTLLLLGDFESARQYAMRGVEIWRSRNVHFYWEEHFTKVVACLCHKAFCEWHLGEIESSRANLDEGISLAKELKDMYGLAVALNWATNIAYNEHSPAEVDRLASDLIELSTRHNFASWIATGAVYRGWARSASGETSDSILRIEDGIRNYRATGAVLLVPHLLTLKAEALHLADRTLEALAAIKEAEILAERLEHRIWRFELHQLRGVFLTSIGADESQIEASYCAAIRTAKEQKSVSLEKRAEATYEEYRRQKASAGAGRGGLQQGVASVQKTKETSILPNN
jgi:hypothetical protein